MNIRHTNIQNNKRNRCNTKNTLGNYLHVVHNKYRVNAIKICTKYAMKIHIKPDKF
jgi:hypothetical protein